MTDNSGLKVGLGATALGVASAYSVKPMINKLSKIAIDNARKHLPAEDAYEATKQIFANRKALKGVNMLRPMLFAIPIYLGCGAIVDWANRKQRANSEPNATTKNGNEYTKVNMGKKLGAALGAAAYVISGIINKGQLKKVLAASPNKAVTIASSVGIGMFGGYILGAIADKLSNKQAAKEADNAAA